MKVIYLVFFGVPVPLFALYPQTAQVAAMIIFWSDLFCQPDRIGQSNSQLRNSHVTTASISFKSLVGQRSLF